MHNKIIQLSPFHFSFCPSLFFSVFVFFSCFFCVSPSSVIFFISDTDYWHLFLSFLYFTIHQHFHFNQFYTVQRRHENETGLQENKKKVLLLRSSGCHGYLLYYKLVNLTYFSKDLCLNEHKSTIQNFSVSRQ